MLLPGRARERTPARFPQTPPAPATGSRRQAAWLSLCRSRRVGAPHGTDFVAQHRQQLRIRLTFRRATKVQAPEIIWNLPVATQVALVVLVDNHRHDEAPTHDPARSLYRHHPLAENVAPLPGLR